jgi:AcrR family transcriptional regulator
MRGLASQLKISATQIYQHFGGKGAILDELRLQASAEILADIVIGLEADDLRTAAIRVARRYVDWALANPWRYRLLMENETLGDAELSDEQRERFVVANRGAVEVIAARIGGPDVSQDRVAMYFARWWAWLHGTVALVLNKRIRATHPATPVADVSSFITESVVAATDTLLAALEAKKTT